MGNEVKHTLTSGMSQKIEMVSLYYEVRVSFSRDQGQLRTLGIQILRGTFSDTLPSDERCAYLPTMLRDERHGIKT